MKATFNFDLENADDLSDFYQMVDASSMYCVLFDIKYNMRKNIQWKIDQMDISDPYDVLDLVFDQINNKIKEFNFKQIDL